MRWIAGRHGRPCARVLFAGRRTLSVPGEFWIPITIFTISSPLITFLFIITNLSSASPSTLCCCQWETQQWIFLSLTLKALSLRYDLIKSSCFFYILYFSYDHNWNENFILKELIKGNTDNLVYVVSFLRCWRRCLGTRLTLKWWWSSWNMLAR